MYCETYNEIHTQMGTISKDLFGITFLDGIKLRCGARLSLWRDNHSDYIDGRIRYTSDKGFCFFNETVGDIELKNGMKAIKIPKQMKY